MTWRLAATLSGSSTITTTVDGFGRPVATANSAGVQTTTHYDAEGRTTYEQIRRDMYSASYGERDPETAAVACPVFGVGQQFVGALTVSGPKYRLEAAGVERILPVLFRHASELTRVLGGDPAMFPVVKAKKRPAKRATRS